MAITVSVKSMEEVPDCMREFVTEMMVFSVMILAGLFSPGGGGRIPAIVKILVRGAGLEPAHLAIQEPKSCVSAIPPAAHYREKSLYYLNNIHGFLSKAIPLFPSFSFFPVLLPEKKGIFFISGWKKTPTATNIPCLI